MRSEDVAAAVALDKQHVWHHMVQHARFEKADPPIMVEGRGVYVKDASGKEYIDAVAGGVWTVNVGYGRERIADAVCEQLKKLPFYVATAGSLPGSQLAEKLTGILPYLNRVFYTVSGTDANEKAYKIVRQRAHYYNQGKKHKIVFRDRDYHGSSIGALSSTGHPQRRESYGPFVDGFIEMPHNCCYRCPFGKTYGQCNIECAYALEEIIQRVGPEHIGSVVLEPIVAGGGVVPPVKEYFPIIRKICNNYDVLLHIDEVVCGIGRTGRWFGHQHFGIEPDMVTIAKGVASGYAAFAVLMATEKLFELFKSSPQDDMSHFRVISTYGGCVSGPTAALETLRIVEEERLVDNSARLGLYLKDRLFELQEKYEIIGEIRGIGLFCGLEMVRDRRSKEPLSETTVGAIVQNCANHGVLIGRVNRSLRDGLNNVLLLAPPLNISKAQVDEVVSALDKGLAALR